jgi:inorganic pyrophosphatase
MQEAVVVSQPLVIDRPRGSHHPRFQENINPLDYGYLERTISGDGDGIDVWLGMSGTRHLSAVILTVDLRKRDTEIKFLLDCTEQEIQTILDFHNDSGLRATLVRRPTDQGDAK